LPKQTYSSQENQRKNNMSNLIAAALKELEKYAEQNPEQTKEVVAEKALEKTQLVEKDVQLWKEESNPNRLTIIEE